MRQTHERLTLRKTGRTIFEFAERMNKLGYSKNKTREIKLTLTPNKMHECS